MQLHQANLSLKGPLTSDTNNYQYSVLWLSLVTSSKTENNVFKTKYKDKLHYTLRNRINTELSERNKVEACLSFSAKICLSTCAEIFTIMNWRHNELKFYSRDLSLFCVLHVPFTVQLDLLTIIFTTYLIQLVLEVETF